MNTFTQNMDIKWLKTMFVNFHTTNKDINL